MRAHLAIALFVAACSGPATTTPAANRQAPVIPAESELSPMLEPLAWLPGDWKGDEGTEHWTAVGGAIYGVALHKRGMFEVMIIDDGDGASPPDGVIRFIAMPNGDTKVEFRGGALTTKSARFDNPAHDAPKNITYERTADGLSAVLDIDGNRRVNFAFTPTTRTAAPELEALDRATRRDMLGGIPATTKVVWEPTASGRAERTGFTLGKATFTDATSADHRRTYVTIWTLEADGTWMSQLETGRAVNAP